jgi:hypothetical protein
MRHEKCYTASLVGGAREWGQCFENGGCRVMGFRTEGMGGGGCDSETGREVAVY